MKPLWSHTAGDRFIGRRKWKLTHFYALLQKGDYASQFERRLRKVVSFLKKHSAFLNALTKSNGEAEIILNHTINLQDEEGDKNFELSLAPAFVVCLASQRIGLRVQGWQGKAPRKRSGVRRRAKTR